MQTFDEIYTRLNDEQKHAVETINGPLLVLAGPGTGKTQLLSARVARILQSENAPENILCLTFTESGAQNMRERLSSMIGPAAYDVHISTYHSFGSDIIRSYPEYFESFAIDRSDDVRMERPIDELTQVKLVGDIVNRLPYDNPMVRARYYVKSVVSTISAMKRESLSPELLRTLAKDNLAQIHAIQPHLNEVVNRRGGISRKKVEYLNQYAGLLEVFSSEQGSLIDKATLELSEAHLASDKQNGSSKPLTEWKNKWLVKDEQDQFTFTDAVQSERMLALADVYQAYETEKQQKGLYDFDDMILRAIRAIRENDALRFNLQERYQYILLDEFQDTNTAQFDLVYEIANHPVHEGRPNIMAVGDDDQAIYAFQGAEVGNMTKFTKAFREVEIINLVKNYRSHHEIIHVAHKISNQIENRLHHHLEDVDKTLEASNDTLPADATIERHEFIAQASEYAWVAERIRILISEGADPSEIAVLAPKHKLLEGLVPFINAQSIPVTYDKRENILQTPIVEAFRMMVELLVALAEKNHAEANRLFPMIMSLPFWSIPTQDIWQVNWDYAKREENRQWAQIALESTALEAPVSFLLALASRSETMTLEAVLDTLSGVHGLVIGENDQTYTSPLREYYFSKAKRESAPLEYYETVSHLSVIRSKLREYQGDEDRKLTLQSFIDIFRLYDEADQSLVNSHPIAQAESSVQLMTAFKAKGLEFENVFILSAHDDVWGSKAKSNANKLSLPPNLDYIRYVGGDEDELRRLLFVAVTRAKHGLFITSHELKENGKRNEAVKYLNEAEGKTLVLPDDKQDVRHSDESKERIMAHIETLWQAKHVNYPIKLQSLLRERLQSYRMSPTHLNNFIDMVYGGPEAFYFGTLLRFPQAPSTDGEYGTAIHNTLEWYQNRANHDNTTTPDEVVEWYKQELQHRYISGSDMASVTDKGEATLRAYLAARRDMFAKPARTEVNFYNEGVLIGPAHLSGKIDRLEIDEKNKVVRIVDYKTGIGATKWKSDIKLLKYEQQLYFYKLLIEGSHTFRGYTVESARLEFVEPSLTSGQILEPLYVDYSSEKEAQLRNLIGAIWTRIQHLDFPDTSECDASVSGTKKFIQKLLEEADE